MKDIIINLSKAKIIFPDKFTKVRREDLIGLGIYDKVNSGNEFMAIREGQRIKLREID